MTAPTISVVTPSYNQAEFIEDTLESVKNQTHPSVEHLVVDGGSTDGTLDLLREYEDRYDLSWTSEPDEGQSDAINKGFERASGDVVAWLNSDDVYFDVNALSRVADYFDRYRADVIYGDLAYVDRNATVTAIDARPDFDAEKLAYRILIGQPATFFRRRVVEEERLDTSLDYGMDYEYWVRLSRRFTFRHVPDVLAGFRTYSEQKSQDRSAMNAEVSEILASHGGVTSPGHRVVLDNAVTEATRLLRGLRLTYDVHRNPPELAFDGELAPFTTMVANLGPGPEDVRKAIRRWRSDGAAE